MTRTSLTQISFKESTKITGDYSFSTFDCSKFAKGPMTYGESDPRTETTAAKCFSSATKPVTGSKLIIHSAKRSGSHCCKPLQMPCSATSMTVPKTNSKKKKRKMKRRRYRKMNLWRKKR